MIDILLKSKLPLAWLLVRPLNNVQFWPRSRKAKISTAGIYGIFRGLKFEPDERDWAKGDIIQRSQDEGVS